MSSRARRFAPVACRCAIVFIVATIVPRAWSGREAQAWLADDLATERGLAEVVAARARRGVRPSDLHTGSLHFDGEWALVTNQMTVLGLGQLILAHPAERERYLPAIRAAVERLLAPDAREFGTRAYGEDGFATLATDRGHAYLGYLDMALGMQRLVDPAMDATTIAIHDELTASLERRLARAPHALIETFPGVTFPADVAAVVGAIALHGMATGRDHRVTLTAWSRAFRRDCIEPTTGFVYQTVDPATGRHTGAPRGSGTALIVYFVSFADLPLARDLDRAIAARGHASFLGFGGIREYPPPTRAGSGDIDSGPVVFGVSVSATGFGIAGAKMFGDEDRFTSLLRTAYLFGAPVSDSSGRGYLVGAGLGDAILLAMMTARGAPPTTVEVQP